MRYFVQRSEARLATLFIGVIQIIWSTIPIVGGDWRFIKILKHHHGVTEWFGFMVLCGLLLVLGSICKWRSGRQVGLFLSSSAWFACFGLWLNYWVDTGKWLISPVTMLFPLLGLFCLVLYVNDVAQKPKGGR